MTTITRPRPRRIYHDDRLPTPHHPRIHPDWLPPTGAALPDLDLDPARRPTPIPTARALANQAEAAEARAASATPSPAHGGGGWGEGDSHPGNHAS